MKPYYSIKKCVWTSLTSSCRIWQTLESNLMLLFVFFSVLSSLALTATFLFFFFPFSWHKTHMWATGDVSIFKTSSEEFWRTVRSRRSEQKAASLSHSFCFWALILWGSSSSVWWSYLICTGLVSGGHTGWLRHSCCYGNLVDQG